MCSFIWSIRRSFIFSPSKLGLVTLRSSSTDAGISCSVTALHTFPPISTQMLSELIHASFKLSGTCIKFSGTCTKIGEETCTSKTNSGAKFFLLILIQALLKVVHPPFIPHSAWINLEVTWIKISGDPAVLTVMLVGN